METFLHFIDDGFLSILVKETNRYGEQFLVKNQLSKRSRMAAWKETTKKEIFTFIAVTILIGPDIKPAISYYWCRRPIFISQ